MTAQPWTDSLPLEPACERKIDLSFPVAHAGSNGNFPILISSRPSISQFETFLGDS